VLSGGIFAVLTTGQLLIVTNALYSFALHAAFGRQRWAAYVCVWRRSGAASLTDGARPRAIGRRSNQRPLPR